jgi:hypothetical protein
MSKPNKDQTEQEFAYTFACKKMMHELAAVQMYLDAAKSAGMQGVSKGALQTVEIRLYDLKAALYNALKTV